MAAGGDARGERGINRGEGMSGEIIMVLFIAAIFTLALLFIVGIFVVETGLGEVIKKWVEFKLGQKGAK